VDETRLFLDKIPSNAHLLRGQIAERESDLFGVSGLFMDLLTWTNEPDLASIRKLDRSEFSPAWMWSGAGSAIISDA
jgi:hypothetical protein